MHIAKHGRTYLRLCGTDSKVQGFEPLDYEAVSIIKRLCCLVHEGVIGQAKIKQPVKIAFRWYEKNSRRDMDNIAFAKKFILDALVKKGVLQDDGWKWVKGFTDEFFIDKKNPRIEVELKTEEEI